jgi:hypothetical protein
MLEGCAALFRNDPHESLYGPSVQLWCKNNDALATINQSINFYLNLSSFSN